jgi:hypothetical protein
MYSYFQAKKSLKKASMALLQSLNLTVAQQPIPQLLTAPEQQIEKSSRFVHRQLLSLNNR